MAVCPWCKATVVSGDGPCPRCGKVASEHPSLAGMRDVPELDIPARPSKAQPAARPVAHAQPAQQARAPAKGAPAPQRLAQPMAPLMPSMPGDLEDDDPDDAVKFDLDFSKGPPAPVAAAPPAVATSQSRAATPGGVTGNVAIRGAPADAAGPVHVDASTGLEVQLDPYEIKALADYGDAPEKWWRTPMYAYRVLRRRPELKKLADAKRREAERTRGAADDALSAFAELARPQAEKLAAYSVAIDQVRATEQVLRERDAVLAAEADAHKQRMAQFEAKLAELEAQLAQVQVEERNMVGEAGESDALMKRAEARVKRAEIEIRNALIEAGMPDPNAPAPSQKGEP